MYTVVKRRQLNELTVWLDIAAPQIAKKAKPGQFIILRVDDKGERVPLTIAGSDEQKGTITIIFQQVGVSTIKLGRLKEGEHLQDLVGPLGEASHFGKPKRAAVIGGGLGVAISYPQAKALYDQGIKVDCIMGFRNHEAVILQEEMAAVCDELVVLTDDGSNGKKGFVTNGLKERLDQGISYDLVVAIGPLPMMKAVSELTRPLGIKTIVSMNSIMIDGTGMCGGCRVTVDGQTKFACVDGPDFDGHLVDFDSAIKRSRMFKKQVEEKCNLLREVNQLD